jgi:nitrate reductase gamma subunit
MTASTLNYLLFAVAPYVAITLLLSVSLWRFFFQSYKFSSLSSEFLESRELFWGSVPWHYGILVLFFGHLIGFLFPREVLLWNSVPVRLVILEVTALAFALLALVGLTLLIRRRLGHARIRAVTSWMDLLVLGLLLFQVVTGILTALTYRWGSSWYASILTPYLRSVFTLSPKVELMADLPWLVKSHVIGSMVIVGILPFTRLVHFLVPPVSYLWRRYQLVIWNWDRKKIREAKHGQLS